MLALYEAMEQIDLSNVPARGRWGTPTAQAFPISLKSAFQAAIAEHHNRKNRKTLYTPILCAGIPVETSDLCASLPAHSSECAVTLQARSILDLGGRVGSAAIGDDEALEPVADELLDQGRAIEAHHRGVDREPLRGFDAEMDRRLDLADVLTAGRFGGLAAFASARGCRRGFLRS